MGVAQQNLKLPTIPAETNVEGIVDIGKHDSGELARVANVVPGRKKEDVEQWFKRYIKFCPYSHATRNNVKVTFTSITTGNEEACAFHGHCGLAVDCDESPCLFF